MNYDLNAHDTNFISDISSQASLKLAIISQPKLASVLQGVYNRMVVVY